MRIVGIGTDISETQRIARMIERHGDVFLNRVYTAREIAYCQQRKASTEHYTGRWCAKEAVLKALGTGWSRGIRWRDLEIHNDLTGKPRIRMEGVAAEIAHQLGIDEILISISHCRTHATAYALAIGSQHSGTSPDSR